MGKDQAESAGPHPQIHPAGEVKMKRSIDRWRNCDPSAMAHEQSDAAKQYAFEDARQDILELHAENERFKALLKLIAYPRRGTDDERHDIFSIAELIQSAYTSEQLS
jgi:hypothetical protein